MPASSAPAGTGAGQAPRARTVWRSSVYALLLVAVPALCGAAAAPWIVSGPGWWAETTRVALHCTVTEPGPPGTRYYTVIERQGRAGTWTTVASCPLPATSWSALPSETVRGPGGASNERGPTFSMLILTTDHEWREPLPRAVTGLCRVTGIARLGRCWRGPASEYAVRLVSDRPVTITPERVRLPIGGTATARFTVQ